MATWTLEKAKTQLSEVVRRALAHDPQVVTWGRHDAVVIIAREDYERLIAPIDLVDFMRGSPIAQANAGGELHAGGELPGEAFERSPDPGRAIAL